VLFIFIPSENFERLITSALDKEPRIFVEAIRFLSRHNLINTNEATTFITKRRAELLSAVL